MFGQRRWCSALEFRCVFRSYRRILTTPRCCARGLATSSHYTVAPSLADRAQKHAARLAASRQAVAEKETAVQRLDSLLPPPEDPNKMCLVLDLDETLVHYYEVGGEGMFRVRPGCDKFLKEMSEIYEVVIFTAAMQDYADWVLD